MKHINDDNNICLRCKKVVIIGKHTPKGSTELTWCNCMDVNLGGPNKGERLQCKAFEPKENIKPKHDAFVVPKCDGCNFASSHDYTRHGKGNSANVGVFQQKGHFCNHPNCKRHMIFYGKTSPKSCPLKLSQRGEEI